MGWLIAAAAVLGELLTLVATLRLSREVDTFYAHELLSLSRSFYMHTK